MTIITLLMVVNDVIYDGYDDGCHGRDGYGCDNHDCYELK